MSKAQAGSAASLLPADWLFNLALQWNASNSQLHRNQGLVYVMQTDWAKAASQFEKSLAIEPNNILAHYALANVYKQQGRYRDAIHELQWAQAWKSLRVEYTEQGLALLDTGKPVEAETEFRNLIGLAARSSDGYWVYWLAQGYEWLGWSLERQGKQAEAIEAYQTAISLGREQGLAPRPMIDLARLHAQLGRFDQSAELIDFAVSLSPSDRYIPLAAGDLYERHHDCSKAMEYYRLAAQIPPFDGLPWQKVAECSLQQGDYMEAATAAQQGIEQNGGLAALHYILGKAYLEIGNKAVACQEFQAAIVLSPTDAALRRAVVNASCP